LSLFVIATPIGNLKDITFHGLEVLTSVDVVVGEERKEVERLCRKLEIQPKELRFLNEHTGPEEQQNIFELCKKKKVALVSDAGTPGFCDPGADLVALCYKEGVKVKPLPGASSLMAALSVCGMKLDEFLFRGFLPQKKEERTEELKKLKSESRAVILMDTPYRLNRLMDELLDIWPKRRAFLACDLTIKSELLLSGTIEEIHKKLGKKKAEFILIVGASGESSSNTPNAKQKGAKKSR
jgi:16S rRNA (cytidine1402-2'-O)-methyltransferase